MSPGGGCGDFLNHCILLNHCLLKPRSLDPRGFKIIVEEILGIRGFWWFMFS
jgi:hypothetical protein